MFCSEYFIMHVLERLAIYAQLLYTNRDSIMLLWFFEYGNTLLSVLLTKHIDCLDIVSHCVCLVLILMRTILHSRRNLSLLRFCNYWSDQYSDSKAYCVIVLID